MNDIVYDIILPALLGAAITALFFSVFLLIDRHRRHQPDIGNSPDTNNTNNTDNNTANYDARFLMLHQQMQAVNDNVNRLQQLFRNVKLRGSWGEVQLGAILAEMLSPAQYQANVAVDPLSSERVEFALKLPLPDRTYLWLPIDAKCPIEDFERLQQAWESNDTAAAQSAGRAFKRRLLAEAADISANYIRPPYSTDFAMLFLPIEAIYQYAISDAELVQAMERQHRVIPTGPSTISAVLNLLQLSHRSMALAGSEQEIRRLLGTARDEFASFGDALTKTRKKSDELAAHLDNMARRLRVIEHKLSVLENAGDDPQKQLD